MATTLSDNQKLRSSPEEKNPSKFKSPTFPNTQNPTSASCSECNKRFSSLKALFGHMRCHPDRNWRGIQPPTISVKPNSLISDTQFHVSDRNSPEKSDFENTQMMNWPVSAKKISNSLISDHQFHSSDKNSPEKSDFENTQILNWPVSAKKTPDSPISDHQFHVPDQNSPEKSDFENSQSLNWPVSAKKARRENRASETAEDWETAVFLLMLSDGGRENFPAMFSGEPEKYKCSTCRKAFSSRQALGGHRASHSKVKGCFEEEKVESSNSTGEIQIRNLQKPKLGLRRLITRVVAEPAPEKFSGGSHECLICHKVFLTGQALGGHKRCHWTGERVTERLPESGRIPVGFDLNEPAPVGEEDLEVVYSMIDVVPASLEALKQLGFDHGSVFR